MFKVHLIKNEEQIKNHKKNKDAILIICGEKNISDAIIESDFNNTIIVEEKDFKNIYFYDKSPNESCLFVLKEKSRDHAGFVLDEEGYISNLSFGLSNIWIDVAILKQKERKIFNEVISRPHRGKYLFYEILNEMISCGAKFSPIFPAKKIENIASYGEYQDSEVLST